MQQKHFRKPSTISETRHRSMDGHADIPPSHSSGLSQYPTTYNPFGNGGDERFNRATMLPPPSGSSLAPFPPCHQFQPTTDQPSQYWSPNFIPGSSPSQQQPLLSQQPPSSLFSLPPLSPSSLRYSQSATVANKEMTPTLHPCTQMLNSSSGSNLAHKRGSSDNFVSLLAAQNNQQIYPKPIEMPVGVRSSVRENAWSHEDVNVDVSNGNKRRAGNEIARPNRIWRSASADSSLYAPPNPQGVSVDVGNDIAYGGVFTAYQLSKIAACDDLKKMAKTDPKRVKRLLSNREAAARSKERKALRQSELEIQVQTLYTQIAKLTAELELEKRERMAADDECVRMKILLGGGEEHAQVRDHELNNYLSGEVHRLTEEVSRQREEMSRLREEVSEYRRKESERTNANMLEQLNINQQFQETPQQTNYNFE